MFDDRLAQSAQILCVGKEWFPEVAGGLNRYVYELTQQLATTQNKVELCIAGRDDSPPDSCVKLTRLAGPHDTIIRRLLRSKQAFSHRVLQTPDAINLHFALYSFPLLGQLPQDVPVTFTFHGPWAEESQREGQHSLGTQVKAWMEQQVYQRCDRFIVLSQAFGKILHETYGIPWEKIHVIPGGVNIQRFQPDLSRHDARKQLGFPTDRQILFSPRRLVNRMGLDKLLTAMVQIKQQVPDIWLAIAGKGPLQSALEQQANELELTEHVKFLGYVPDEQLPIAYQAADLTVVPSQSLEGFGLILVESLACGTPALCTPVGGMPEVVSGLHPRLVTASTDADAIASRIVEWLGGELPLPERSSCRDYACRSFDWGKIAPLVQHVLLS